MKDKTTIIQKIFGYCPHCKKWFKHPKIRRMSTEYNNDEDNYCYECKDCYKITEEYWNNMWNDLYN